MFEQELEMEKKEGSAFGPVLIILLLVGLFVGGIGVVVFQSKQTLKPEQATAAVEAKLKSAAPVSITFHTGNVSYTAGDKPSDPQYKLFEKAGFLKIAKGQGICRPGRSDSRRQAIPGLVPRRKRRARKGRHHRSTRCR